MNNLKESLTIFKGKAAQAAKPQPQTRKPNLEKCLAHFEALGAEFYKGFKIKPEERAFYENLINYAVGAPFKSANWENSEEEAGDNSKGLFICGGIGAGKTAALNTLRRFCASLRSLKTNFKFYTTADVETSFNKNGFAGLLRFEVGAAAFDDLGAEGLKAYFYKTECAPMQRIIQNRYIQFVRKGTKTHFTSNFNLDLVSKAYGARCASRLQEMTNKIIYVGEDRRSA